MNNFQISLLVDIAKQYAEQVQHIAKIYTKVTPIQQMQLEAISKDLDTSAKILATQVKQCEATPEKCNAIILYHCSCLGNAKAKIKKMGVKE